MLDIREAAELIGECSPRSWQRWESGKVPIPQHIATKMLNLVQARNNIIKGVWNRHCAETSGTNNTWLQVRYYHSFDEHKQDFPHESKVRWRIYQSAIAALFSEKDDIELI